jgi:hypothetical protein
MHAKESLFLSKLMFNKLEYYKPKLQRKGRKKSILSPGQWVSASSRTGQPKPEMVLKSCFSGIGQ